jgi:hypothetical protein
MTDDHQRDTEIEDAIRALVRRGPPADHVARVLAATGPSARGAGWGVHEQFGGRAGGWLRPRWVIPAAASVAVVAGAWWQAARVTPPGLALDAAQAPASTWGAPRDVERPVLPPQMYWAMDPFTEFATLRPRVGHGAGSALAATPPPFGSATAAPLPSEVVAQAIDDEHVVAGAPAPTALPEITLATIVPIPVLMPPLPRPAAIELTEIAMAPITLAPIDTHTLPEENP